MNYSLAIGLRYLRSKRREAFVSLITLIATLGVGLGVMTLDIVLSVMSGFEEDLRDRILGFTPHLVIEADAGVIRRDDDLVERVRAVPGVVAAAPFVSGQVMLSSANEVAGGVLRGVTAESDAVLDISAHLIDGSMDALAEKHAVEAAEASSRVALPGIVLGRQLARRLAVRRGDALTVVAPQPMLTAIGPVPRVKRFVVVGVFESGMADFDATLAFVPLADAQRFFRLGSDVNGVEVRVDDLDDAAAVGAQVAPVAGISYRVRDWMQSNQTLFSALRLETTVYSVVLFLIVLVAAFNIVATLVMVVMEKRKDIAVLKSLGATGGGVAAIFLWKGLIIGASGTLAGTVAGWGVCAALQRYGIPLPPDVFYVSTVPVRMHAVHFLTVLTASLAICLLASVYPARRAAKLAPVDIIRYE
jgi:lipoprotein-releasing system permease protein